MVKRAVLACRVQSRLGEAPNARDHFGESALGHLEPALRQEGPPASRVERIARERVTQPLQRLRGNARRSAGERALDRFDKRRSIEGECPGQLMD